MDEKDRKRFWDKVEIGVYNDCWEWQASTVKGGYGNFYCKGKMSHAHRFAWRLTNGSIPDGLLVLHKCDNPLCCNPSHLFLGTFGDNMLDMYAKGRHPVSRGEKNPKAKLHKFQIMKIRRLYKAKFTNKEIAILYSVHESTIARITSHKSWSHIP